MRNRRGVNWTLENEPWSVGVARRRVVAQLGEWGYGPGPELQEAVEAVTGLLVTAAASDRGRRISVHLSDQERQVCVVALSHQAGAPTGHVLDGDRILHEITEQTGVVGCGTDAGPHGRRVWAVIEL
ncbi:hypothetical protein [Streptomyces pratensis]|uniref:hypothetical protein n=1 Tax=Streptomyces pratensis TaxID=1169025 RepID=UPI003016316D